MKPKVVYQGMIVAERDGQGFLMMFPDGKIEFAVDRQTAEKKATKWMQKNLDKEAIGVGKIEWRL